MHVACCATRLLSKRWFRGANRRRHSGAMVRRVAVSYQRCTQFSLPARHIHRHCRLTCSAVSSQQPLRDYVVGIDLGTTNSAVAFIENGKPRCIPNADGETVTPSVLTVLPGGEVVVGKRAKRQAVLHPSTTYYSVKRLIGRPFSDKAVQAELPRLSFQVVSDEAGAACLSCPHVAPGRLYPEEVSAQVLSQLLADATAYTGGQISKAVISVPAYFNEAQREATATAGRLAGLDTVRIIREPVAAALAYGLNLQEDQTVLVFDLGGGTFDISLLEVGNGTVEVLSTGGDAHLGGDDWDQAIIDYLVQKHLHGSGLNLSDPSLLANLKALAEGAKLHLSVHDSVVLRMPVGGPGGGPLQVPFSRDMLESLTADLWRRCRQPLDQACWQAGVDLGQVVGELDSKKEQLRSRGVPSWKLATLRPSIRPKRRGALTKIVLVGGATRMPAVARLIRNMTGIEPIMGAVDPDEAVALGAAVQAGILQGDISDMMVIDQWQASLMRALAQMQLKQDPAIKEAVEERFSLEDDDEATSAGRRQPSVGVSSSVGGANSRSSSDDSSSSSLGGGNSEDLSDVSSSNNPAGKISDGHDSTVGPGSRKRREAAGAQFVTKRQQRRAALRQQTPNSAVEQGLQEHQANVV